ncbi:MAG: glutaredoxin 3 [Acidobacteriota bacterium]|nr:glutaredoxin 3 [Acidobacteriota bacterium]
MSELVGKQGEIKIYTTPWCPFCIRAKRLLDNKGAQYEDTNVSTLPSVRAELRQLTGSRTVPQIFINGQSIGGCDELHALDAAGKLDPMLAAVAG